MLTFFLISNKFAKWNNSDNKIMKENQDKLYVSDMYALCF